MLSSVKIGKAMMLVIFILISLESGFQPGNASALPLLASVLVVPPKTANINHGETSTEPDFVDNDMEKTGAASISANETVPTAEGTTVEPVEDSTAQSSNITTVNTTISIDADGKGDESVGRDECFRSGCSLKKDRTGIICCKWYPRIGRWLIQYISPPCPGPNHWFYTVEQVCLKIHVPKNVNDPTDTDSIIYHVGDISAEAREREN